MPNNKRRKVYIAGPMSKGDAAEHFCEAMKAYRDLIRNGYAPMCPQLTWFASPFMRCPLSGSELEHSDWLAVDLPWVLASDAVLRLPGESVGADMEVAAAQEHGIPVFTDIVLLMLCFECFGKE